MLNYMERTVDDATSFEDPAGTALLAGAQFRIARITGSDNGVAFAARDAGIVDLVDANGWLTGAVDPLAFDKPAGHDGAQSGGCVVPCSTRCCVLTAALKASQWCCSSMLPCARTTRRRPLPSLSV